MTVSPWFFFLFVVHWVLAIFGTLAAAVAIVLLLVSLVAAIREIV